MFTAAKLHTLAILSTLLLFSLAHPHPQHIDVIDKRAAVASASTTCYTTYDSVSVATTTRTTSTSTASCSTQSTSWVTVTKSKPASTFTRLTTLISTTTNPTKTDTATATEWTTTVSTSTQGPVLKTSTASTSTISTSTITIAASAGFSAAADTLGDGSGADTAPEKRSPAAKSSKSYIQAVSCNVYYSKCNTAVVSKTTTSIITPPVVTAARTIFIVTTIMPNAFTTTTVTSTNTQTTVITPIPETTVTTSTSTVVSTVYYYAACASNNFVSSVGEQAIETILNPNSIAAALVLTNANTAYDCCVAALLDPVGSVFQYNPGSGCTILEATQCTAIDQSFVWTPSTGNIGQTFVGNAYCGSMGKPTTTPAQCGNGGTKWALYYDNDYNAWNNPNNWDPTTIQSESPLFGPSTSKDVGGNMKGDGVDVNIYNSGISWGTQNRVINQVGYIYASVTGTYTFSSTYANDMLAVWIGPSAYSGWTRASALAVISYYGQSGVTIDMTAGQYYPFRVVFENTWGSGAFQASLFDPQGNDLLTTGGADQPNLVQYSCDGTTAPPFPGFS